MSTTRPGRRWGRNLCCAECLSGCNLTPCVCDRSPFATRAGEAMFAPRVARGQTKSAAFWTDSQTHRRLASAESQPGHDHAGEARGRETEWMRVTGRRPGHANVSWDFSSIPVRSDRADGFPGQRGRPLDLAARGYFESRFGQDFSQVRIYSDGAAARSASALGARAYTVGEAIIFNEAEYSPESLSDRHLLAHELAHVVQQRRGGAPVPVTGNPNLETAAQSAADQVARGSSVEVTGVSAIGIARQAQGRGRKAPPPASLSEMPFVPTSRRSSRYSRQRAAARRTESGCRRSGRSSVPTGSPRRVSPRCISSPV